MGSAISTCMTSLHIRPPLLPNSLIKLTGAESVCTSAKSVCTAPSRYVPSLIDAGKYIALEGRKNGAKTQYGLAPDRFIASARGVLRRRSPGSVRIVGGAVLFFGRRAIRTSPVPPGGMEKRQLPLSQSTRPSPQGDNRCPERDQPSSKRRESGFKLFVIGSKTGWVMNLDQGDKIGRHCACGFEWVHHLGYPFLARSCGRTRRVAARLTPVAPRRAERELSQLPARPLLPHRIG